jgi:hypothetical protein
MCCNVKCNKCRFISEVVFAVAEAGKKKIHLNNVMA